MRIGVVDIGTNSTRLLIAEIDDAGRISELDRRSNVTRLGRRVDADGKLSEAAMHDTWQVVDDYRARMQEVGIDKAVALMTSAVRDATNGAAFAESIRDRHGIAPMVLTGEQEARLTYAGATAGVEDSGAQLVIDVGGGSTELVVGRGGRVAFHTSTQLGVVRQGERYLEHDPPLATELSSLQAEAKAIIAASLPRSLDLPALRGIAVAGTATQSAAIDLGLVRYDPRRVHGHVLTRQTLLGQLDHLRQLPLEERQRVRGVHPDRALVIVPGLAILIAALDAFRLQEVTVSEHDILLGAALGLARPNARQPG
jgi:exopolyphosphatase / guanosine-5'-triphosphate,3'-diphosphate pyrophosphatase